MRRVPPFLVLVFVLSLAGGARGLPEDPAPVWKVTTRVGPDAEVGGWFLNLGRTGARATLDPEHPRELRVAHVFVGTPAHRKLRVGDRILGLEGRDFSVPHRFGYGMEVFGYHGPMQEFGDALEMAPGDERRGKLSIDLIRGDAPKQVALALGTRSGRFADTYPFDCAKSERILETCLKWLRRTQREDGLWHGRVHLNAFAALALLAAGERQDRRRTRRAVRAMGADTHAEDTRDDYLCWNYGLYGIVLGEYYLAREERWVLDELREVDAWLRGAQAPDGGFGHRAHDPEGLRNGYGSICMITAQALMAWSLMARCGLELDEARYQAARDFLVRGTNEIGYVWYEDGNAEDKGWADMGRTGAAVLAHALRPEGGEEFAQYASRGARCIGDHPETFPDTHGSPILGMGWTALAALHAPGAFRRLMDRHVWFWNLTQCPDGSFVHQPNRDNNPQDYAEAPRLSATAVTALIFATSRGRLRMMAPVTTDQTPRAERSAR